jgi:DNA-binding response OmpR family regulator
MYLQKAERRMKSETINRKMARAEVSGAGVALRRILIVDDDPTIRVLVKEIVSGIGYQPVAVADGIQAMRFLTRNNIDLMISDVNLPGISGLELLRWSKAQKPGLPVILMSGESRAAWVPAATENRADAVFSKPFYLHDFSRAIHNLMGRRESWAQTG